MEDEEQPDNVERKDAAKKASEAIKSDAYHSILSEYASSSANLTDTAKDVLTTLPAAEAPSRRPSQMTG